jgi:membrane protease YdiL (CAAX protease family)
VTPDDDVPGSPSPDAGVPTDGGAPSDAFDPIATDRPPPSARPGLSTFTIEGRAAPGLFVVGWLATIIGLGIVVIGAIAPSGFFLYFLGPTILTVGLVAGAGNQAIERRARGSVYAGPSPYLVLAMMVTAIYALTSATGLGLHLVLGEGRIPSYIGSLIVVSLQALVFVGILQLTVVGTGALSWTEMGWRPFDRIQARHFLFGAVLAVPVIFVTGALARVLVDLVHQVPDSPLPPTGQATGLILQLIAGAVIAPLAEEAVFRGFAITAWERTVGETGALIRASLVFALAHVITVSGVDLAQVGGLVLVGFATRVPVGLALGWLYLRTRSIWAPIGLHMAFNGFLLLLGEYVRANPTVG